MARFSITVLAVALTAALTLPAGTAVAAGPAGITGIAVASDPAAVGVPAPRVLPTALDAAAQYEGQTICDPVERPGTKALRRLLLATYGPRPIGTTRGCNVDGRSEHKEGRALDWMVSIGDPVGAAQAEAFLTWLLGPDSAGVAAGNARRLGVMYIVWNNRIWRGYGKPGWGELRGCLKQRKAKPTFDTVCHRTHIHFSLTWDGAAARTSYWSGVPQQRVSCPSNLIRGPLPNVAGVLTEVGLPATTLLNTQTGFGGGGRSCRIQQGDGRQLLLKVAGRGGVPQLGTHSVLLLITPVTPNAPTKITVWPGGRPKPRTATASAPQNGSRTTVARVRLGVRGTVAIATDAGSTDLIVQVVGYFQAAGR